MDSKKMKGLKKLQVLAIIAIVVGLFVLGIDAYLTHIDNPLSLVRKIMPLGKGYVYTIKESDKLVVDDISIPAGAAYEVVMEGDERNLNLLGPGRSVWYSKVDLEPFLNKKVYIFGSIVEGARYWKDHHETIPNEPVFRGGFVVNIDYVEIAE